MSRHALISSQNPVSRQRPVPCMTVRLTPQILLQLNQKPPPDMSFCIKDRTLTIGDVRHTLQAFVEDPSLCEVYSLRSDRLVQVGNIEHKLIVQREVNAMSGSGSTPKASESSSAHSNPLAPRHNNGSSQRAKRPRDSAVKSASGKRPASSASSTPRRLITQSPMAASPDRQLASLGSSSKSSSKINASLPLRDQVVHLLAIQPMSAAGIGRRLSQPGKNLATILKAVAQYEIPGKYRLRDDLLATVRTDAWPYSEQEKILVLKNIESIVVKAKEDRSQEGANTDLTSLSIEDDGVSECILQTPKAVPKKPDVTKSLPQCSTTQQPKKSMPENSNANKRPPTADCTPNKVPPPCSAKQGDDNLPIQSHEDYLACRSRFEQMYPRYSAVDTRLKEIAAEFNSLAVKLDSPQCPPAERRKIQSDVKELYAQLKPEVDRLKAEFNTMHEEMSILKSRIRNYVDTVLTPL